MRDNYDIANLNPRKNPYTEKLKRQVTMNLKITTIDYFKQLAEETGIPYQNLIDLYLDDCVKKGVKPEIDWKKPAQLCIKCGLVGLKIYIADSNAGETEYESFSVM